MKRKIFAALLALCLLAGTAFAADMADVRGYSNKKSGDKYQYVYLGTYPYDENGSEQPLRWRILGREGDQITLLTENIIDVHQMVIQEDYTKAMKHDFDPTPEFNQTELYRWVNDEMTKTILAHDDFSAAIVEKDGGLFYIMHNTDLRRTEWGFPNSTGGYFVEKPGEKVIPLAKNRMAYATPYAKQVVLLPEWKQASKNHYKLIIYGKYGNTSPYWTSYVLEGWKGGMVGGNGHLSWHGKADVQIGVRPALMLDLTKLTITGGDGSAKDPWRMAVLPGLESKLNGAGESDAAFASGNSGEAGDADEAGAAAEDPEDAEAEDSEEDA